jgi:RNA-directed DNA polymerase
VLIPKPGTGEMRPPSIPAVRDRIVQAALKIVLEPVFEAGFLPCSFGFRPRLSAHDALQVPVEECARGRRWVVETDIASCFSAIPHEGLMEAVEFTQSAATVTSTPPTARQHIRQAPR